MIKIKFRIICLLIAAVFLLSSCGTVFKSNQKNDTFLKDSDFLKQKYDIQKKEEPVTLNVGKKAPPKMIKIDSRHKISTGNDKHKKVSKKPKHKADSVKSSKSEIEKKEADEKKIVSKSEVLKNDMRSLFPEGEEVVLSASFFGVEAGRVQLGIKTEKLVNGQEALHFYALGKTSSLFSLVYKVRDSIESLWSPKLKRPLTLAFDVDETKQKYKTRSYFNWKKGKADYFEEGWHKKRGDYQKKKSWKLPNFGQDILSAIFYIRTLPLEVGKTYKFNVMEDEKVIEAQLKVDRRELLKTNIGRIESLVLKPNFKTKGKFKKVGDISIWISDDKYKQLLRVESKIKIGTVTAKVESITRPQARP